MYYESRRYEGVPFPERVDVPTAVTNFPGELFLPPRAWVEKQFNLVHWSRPACGGHFAASKRRICSSTTSVPHFAPYARPHSCASF